MSKSKFRKMLEANKQSIKEARANILEGMSRDAQDKIVRELKEKRRSIELQLLNKTDVYPDSELSLEVVKKDYDPTNTFVEIQKLKLDLVNIDVEIETAVETRKEWFGVEEANWE